MNLICFLNNKIQYPCGFLFCIVFMASACNFSSFTNTSTEKTIPPDWLADWLRDPVCQPPCWYGITPGTTTITDTAKILDELPWVIIDFGPAKPLDMGSKLQLDWVAKQPDQVGGFAFSDDQGRLTVSLAIRGALSLQLENVVETFDLPSDVLAHDCHAGICHTELIYLTSGMVLYLYPSPDWKSYVKISPDTMVKEIWFFPPGREGYSTAFPQYEEGFSKFAVPWDGYTKYKVALP